MNFTPENISELMSHEIFVFGSNLNGYHTGGAAKTALTKFGAIYGNANGLQGQSYAIPTLDGNMQKRSLAELECNIENFRVFAEDNLDKVFYVTKIGCGIAGHSIDDIKSIFVNMTFGENVVLPIEFVQITKGYKITNHQLECKDYQFTIGEIHHQQGVLQVCDVLGQANGFHFCAHLPDCFRYYAFSPKNRVFEIEAYGKVQTGKNKSCTSYIKLIREVPFDEVVLMIGRGVDNTGRCNNGHLNSGSWNKGTANTGKWNDGNCNTGNDNKGFWNTGDLNSGCRNSGRNNSGDANSGGSNKGSHNSGVANSGSYNTGCRNAGDNNSGDRNSGYKNSGNGNSGNYNSGNYNSGNYNSGNCNSGNYNSGAFCTNQNPNITLFNKPSSISINKWNTHPAHILLLRLSNTCWIPYNEMSGLEKQTHPDAVSSGGYDKVMSLTEAWKKFWDDLSNADKLLFTTLENFDSSIFEEITGIKI